MSFHIVGKDQRRLQKNTRHYAKRQMTWFKKDAEMNWVDISDAHKSLQVILEMIK